MRVFVDAHVFDEGFQGSRTFLKGLYSEVLKQGHNYEFYFGTYYPDKLKENFPAAANLNVIKYRFRNKFFRLFIDIPVLIIRNKIDISHFQYICPFFKFSKEIVTMHDVIFLDFPEYFSFRYRAVKSIFYSIGARRADLLTTVSSYSANSIEKHFQISKEKIALIPNGIPEDFDSNARHRSEDFRLKYNLNKFILYISRIEPRKNHLILVKSFVELRLWEKGYNLVFIGQYDLNYSTFDIYINELAPEVRGSIIFLQDINNDELKNFYKNCDLFVYPSLCEGFGIPPLEAVVGDAPAVLCSDRTAMADFYFFGDRFFDPENLADLSAKITRYIESGDADRMKKDKALVLEKYNWKKIASTFLLAMDAHFIQKRK